MKKKQTDAALVEPIVGRVVVSAVVLATGQKGVIIGSHPVGGVRLQYNDGTESPEEYTPWEQVRIVD